MQYTIISRLWQSCVVYIAKHLQVCNIEKLGYFLMQGRPGYEASSGHLLTKFSMIIMHMETDQLTNYSMSGSIRWLHLGTNFTVKAIYIANLLVLHLLMCYVTRNTKPLHIQLKLTLTVSYNYSCHDAILPVICTRLQ